MTKQIPINSRKGVVGHALVSDQDYEWLSRYSWNKGPRGYPYARIPEQKCNNSMHRLIMGLEHGDKHIVDHVNRNKMDNRRENLRIVTQGQNLRNRRKFKTYNGVPTGSEHKHVYKVQGYWRVHLHLWNGYDEELAAKIAQWAHDKLIDEHDQIRFWDETSTLCPE